MQALSLEKTITRDFLSVLGASFIICLAGQISIPLWFTPIPLATQNSVVLLVAALLGSKRGFAATFAFLAQGVIGLPVFSCGAAGMQVLLGPRGGYLIGYLLASFVVGYLVEKRKSCTVALLAGNGLIYLCGAGYLATFVGLDRAFHLGVVPFVLGDCFKMLLSIKLFQLCKKIRN